MFFVCERLSLTGFDFKRASLARRAFFINANRLGIIAQFNNAHSYDPKRKLLFLRVRPISVCVCVWLFQNFVGILGLTLSWFGYDCDQSHSECVCVYVLKVVNLIVVEHIQKSDATYSLVLTKGYKRYCDEERRTTHLFVTTNVFKSIERCKIIFTNRIELWEWMSIIFEYICVCDEWTLASLNSWYCFHVSVSVLCIALSVSSTRPATNDCSTSGKKKYEGNSNMNHPQIFKGCQFLTLIFLSFCISRLLFFFVSNWIQYLQWICMTSSATRNSNE